MMANPQGLLQCSFIFNYIAYGSEYVTTAPAIAIHRLSQPRITVSAFCRLNPLQVHCHIPAQLNLCSSITIDIWDSQRNLCPLILWPQKLVRFSSHPVSVDFVLIIYNRLRNRGHTCTPIFLSDYLRGWFSSQHPASFVTDTSNPNSGLQMSNPAQNVQIAPDASNHRNSISEEDSIEVWTVIPCNLSIELWCVPLTVFSARQDNDFEHHDLWSAPHTRRHSNLDSSCFKWSQDLSWWRKGTDGISSSTGSVKHCK